MLLEILFVLTVVGCVILFLFMSNRSMSSASKYIAEEYNSGKKPYVESDFDDEYYGRPDEDTTGRVVAIGNEYFISLSEVFDIELTVKQLKNKGYDAYITTQEKLGFGRMALHLGF